jgi:tRNA-splicing ligase RtcB
MIRSRPGFVRRPGFKTEQPTSRGLSRSAARAQTRRKDLARQLAEVWIDPNAAGRLFDEAPAAYKDIDAVMRAQRDLVRIVGRVRPVLCHKGV